MVFAFLRKQRFMVAALHNFAVLHNNNKIRIPDCGQAVRDHDACAPLHNVLHSVLNGFFGAGVHAGGGFIKN